MTLEQMQSALSIEKIPACFSSYYAQIKDSWETHAAQILSEEYITKTFADCYAMLCSKGCSLLPVGDEHFFPLPL